MAADPARALGGDARGSSPSRRCRPIWSAAPLMRCFFDPRQLAHAPALELHNGGFVPFAESAGPGRGDPRRARPGRGRRSTMARRRCARSMARPISPSSGRRTRIGARRGATGDASGYAWPVVRRRPLDLDRIDARLGAYSFDASSPIAAGTWEGAYWSAQTALTALDAVLAGERAAFALCRPPGHHAGADYLGGYCYLNNAAIAAEAAVAAGRRVAILDVDYHHGNGTQDIFYARGDVLFVSIHADPRMDYPYFWGHADETGEGEGEGATLNLPLPRGTDLAAYLPALDTALERIAAFAPDLLVVSYGADTFAGDPISHFRLETRGLCRRSAAASPRSACRR